MKESAVVDLQDANANPWYVMMTLYGEQEGADVDEALHAQNRRAWNAWVMEDLSYEMELNERAALSPVGPSEVDAWRDAIRDVPDLHKSEMMRRNGPTFTYPGLPDRNSLVRCSGVCFSNPLVLRYFIFPKGVDFSSSTFMEYADLIGAQLMNGCYFFSARFMQEVNFSSATFQYASFQQANFELSAVFSFATFLETVNFNDASFKYHADFHDVTFKNTADFHSVSFGQGATFHTATFAGFAKFQDAEFGVRVGEGVGQAATCAVDFTDCQFAMPTSFRAATFHARYPIFVGAVLHDQTDFSPGKEYWPNIPQDNPQQALESCGLIRHALAKQGRTEDAHVFFRREMTFAGQIGAWWERLPYHLYRVTSDYGHSIWRPVGALFALWLVGTLGYLIAFTARDIAVGQLRIDLNAAALSFANIFKVFGFQGTYFENTEIQDLSAGLQIMGGLQTVLGFVLLFFLGLGLRNRFRLR